MTEDNMTEDESWTNRQIHFCTNYNNSYFFCHSQAWQFDITGIVKMKK